MSYQSKVICIYMNVTKFINNIQTNLNNVYKLLFYCNPYLINKILNCNFMYIELRDFVKNTF